MQHTDLACTILKNIIKSITNDAINNVARKIRTGDICKTKYSIYSAIERSVSTKLGTEIEKIAAIGDHVEHVGAISTKERKKVTDVIITMENGNKARFEIKTSSNTKTGTDYSKMISDVKNNQEDNIEAWHVVAFQKRGEPENKAAFQMNVAKRRYSTRKFWELCHIKYDDLLHIWHSKDYIIDEQINNSGIIDLLLLPDPKRKCVSFDRQTSVAATA